MSHEEVNRILERLNAIENKVDGHTAMLVKADADIQDLKNTRQFFREIALGVIKWGIIALLGAGVAVYLKVMP